ncbi:histidine-rich glycoprotein-like [Planococcus citri]|uniref:histidine-rich glycoprotein-like n=1 Tax=Planococcus citri TaxID=170843 RepID=UPI0031F8EEE1
MMRAIVIVYAFAVTFACSVFCDDHKDAAGQRILPKKNIKNDLSSAASGYIFRSDGDSPPIFIKLGTGNVERNEGAGVFKNPDLHSAIGKKHHYKETFPILTKKTKPPSKPKDDDVDDEDDIFKEAFKNIPPPSSKHSEPEEDFPILTNIHKYKSTEEIENYDIKNVPEIPEISSEHDVDDYKTPSDIDSPNPLVHHFESEEHEETPSYFEDDKYGAYPKKAYVAPVYEYPHPDEVHFNPRKPPVKYELKPKKPKSSFNSQSDYNNPSDINTSVENFEGEDLNEYSARYASGDYHHKPKKHEFAKGGGESYKEDHHSSHGEKGDKGYKKYHEFDEGEMGHHGKEGKKGYYDDEHGHKKSHHGEGNKYGEHHGGGHGENAAKYGESAGHKKGHKTSGYHNIFHKDEYKKEHKFYDDAHKHGYLDKHGAYDQHHGKKHGHKASGGFHDSSFDHGHKGNSGHYKKGNFDQDHKGHKGKAGHESHYSHHDDYGKKSGHSDSEKHGFHHGH